MRAATASDWWRRVYSRPYRCALKRLQFTDVVGLGSGEIAFDGGITALCGGNGVGKSTMLDAILGSVGPDGSLQKIALATRFQRAELTAQVEASCHSRDIHTTFNPFTRRNEEAPIPIEKLTPAAESQRYVTFLHGITNFSELLEGYSPKRLSEEELEIRKYVVGREYEFCDVFELEDHPGFENIPYFVVSSGSEVYGAEGMGLGELALHITLWQLEQASNDSVVLLEEPENHVSPRSQIALLDVIAQMSVEKGLWVIMSTHSSHILTNVPLTHVRLLYRAGKQVAINSRPTASQLNQVLGTRGITRGMLVAEDSVAVEMARSALIFASPELLHQLEFHVGGSTGHIDGVLKYHPKMAAFRAVGLFDGDQRAVAAAHGTPAVFLPGEVAPDRLLRDAAVSNVASLAERLGRSRDDLTFVVGELQGVDHHDWLVELARRLALPYEVVLRAVLHVWVFSPEGKMAAVEFARDVVAAISEPV